ncbi:amino acid ABC transporter permease [Desulfovibrio sp. OttesenSCG-928-O18]|nr:amino acid ABC transporter permease [Desulfovibrio sp. OttesenSCG-928-O18]
MVESLINIFESLPNILMGSLVTVGIVLCSLSLGFALGVPLAVGQVYGNAALRWPVAVFVWFFRGTPILVLLFLFYYGLPEVLGVDISAVTASCLVLGLASAAYQSQIFRGAILSLPRGQLNAARALGMSDGEGILTVILPQALRFAIPGWTNEFSILLKDSALVFALGGAQDMMARTHFAASRTYDHIAFYLTAGVLYYLITLAGLKAMRQLEKKVYIPGYAAGGSA